MADRFRRFGMSEEQVQNRVAQMKYTTRGIGPGTYKVVVEMNGKSDSNEAIVLKDHWNGK